MNFNSNKESPDFENITISALLNILIEKKALITILTTLFGIFSIFYSLSLSNYYQSSSTVKVVSSDSNKNNSLLVSQYSGLAGLAGIDIGSSDNVSDADLVIEQIKSRDFSKHLMEIDPSIIPNIIAATDFNFSSGRIIYDETLFKSNKWIRESKSGNSVPSYIEVNQKLISSILKISKNEKNGLLRISVEHYSPIFAQYLLNLVITEINSINRTKDQLSSRSSIDYLEKISAQSKIASVQEVISNLIEDQIKILMLSDVKEFYFIEPVDSPFIPEVKSGPSRSLICITITLLGFILSCLLCIVMHFYKRS